MFLKEKIILKAEEQSLIKIEAPCIDEILELVTVELVIVEVLKKSILMFKIKFVRNSATLHVTNISLETMKFDPKDMLQILDLRSVGYYKIKHGILQPNLSKYCRYKSAVLLCEHFNKFVNTLKKEKEETNDKYPWLDKDDERRNMLERYYCRFEKFMSFRNRKERGDGHAI